MCFFLKVTDINRDARRTVVWVCDGYGRPVHRPSPLVSRWLTETDGLEVGRSTVDGDVRHARMI